MQTITPERAEELKAQALAARRASRAPWQNAHVDRLDREREARRIAKEYRQAQREAERASLTKQCRDCGELKPSAAFELLRSGGLRGICRDCRTAQKTARKREARAAHRESPEYQAELERKRQEQAEHRAKREAAKDRAREELQAAKEAEWAALRAAEEARRRKRLACQRGIRKRPLTPERQREIAERIPQLAALLEGTHADQRITDQQSWDSAVSELQRLWLQSGDKTCSVCKATVPPTKLRAPGPANFYPGKCNSCVEAEVRADHVRIFGRPPEPPPLIPMKDGTAITLAEFARRVRERQLRNRNGDPHNQQPTPGALG